MFVLLNSILAIFLALESPSSSQSDNGKNGFEFHVAPMQCYTNQPLRRLFHLLSPSSMKWTEMEKLDDLYPASVLDHDPRLYLQNALIKRFQSPTAYEEGSYLALQLGTNDPQRLQQCLKETFHIGYNFHEINLNCGCPSIESGGASTYGASLMKQEVLTGQLVSSIRSAIDKEFEGFDTKPDISVKCRIGTFDTYEDMLQHGPLNDQDYEKLKSYLSTIENSGGNHVILHCRPAILSGLSSVKNRNSNVVVLDYTFAERIANDFPYLKVTLNGGITSTRTFREMTSKDNGISSYMAGRWILRRPLDLLRVEEFLKRQQQNVGSTSSRISRSHGIVDRADDAIKQYTDHAIQMMTMVTHTKKGGNSGGGHSFTMNELALPLFLVAEQLREMYDTDTEDDLMLEEGGGRGRQESSEGAFLSYDDIERLYDTIEESVQQLSGFLGGNGKDKKNKFSSSGGDVNFKRLSSSFKNLVGTKVANKWKRNRSEL